MAPKQSDSNNNGRMTTTTSSRICCIDDGVEMNETTPLFHLGYSSSSSSSSFDNDNDDEEIAEQKKKHYNKKNIAMILMKSMLYDEFIGMVSLAIPVVGTYVLEMLPGLVSIILVGHLDSSSNSSSSTDKNEMTTTTAEYVDATALAVAFVNLTAMSIGIGLATALDTLCSQAYGANASSYQMGVYVQTGFIVLTGFTVIVVCFVFQHAAEILMALGQPAEVSILAGTFIHYLSPGIPFFFLYELLRKVLQAQNVAKPMFIVAIIANIVNISLGYFLVYYTEWGWLGAAIARTACNMVFPGLLLPYIMFWSDGLLADTFCWTGLDLYEAWKGVPQFLALGIPGMLQLCFEWWAFEVLSLFCGLLPNAVQAIGSNAILLNISSMLYMFYMGVSIAGNVRIGNALGANDPKRAKLASNLTIGLAILLALTCASSILVFRKSIPYLFTQDEEIDQLTRTLLYISAAFQVPDSINAAVQGIFRGSGHQSIGAKLNFVAYYILGIPLACYLAFHVGIGVHGLWLGMAAGLFLVASVGICIISRNNWSALAMEAQERVKGKDNTYTMDV